MRPGVFAFSVIAPYSARVCPTTIAASLGSWIPLSMMQPASVIGFDGYDICYGTPAYGLSDGDILSVIARISGQAAFVRGGKPAFCPVGGDN